MYGAARRSIEGDLSMKAEQIEAIFTCRKPFGTQGERYDAIRSEGRQLAYALSAMCPESRELALAITHLQSAIQWANAAIAINEKETV